MRTPQTPDAPATDADAPRFLLGRRLSPSYRMIVAASLFVLGTLLPFLFLPWFLGAALVLTGSLFLLPRGLSNAPPRTAAEGQWKEVTPKEIARVREIARRSRSWGATPLDGNTGTGLFLLLAVLTGTVILAWVLAPRGWRFDWAFLWSPAAPHLPQVLVLDVALLALPLWFAGLKSRWVPHDLLKKLDALQNILDRLREYPADGWKTRIMLELVPCGGKTLPSDARLALVPEDCPEGFLGIQVQVSLNDVQGTKYPYLYAVVLAREGFGIFDAEFPEPAKEVVERDVSDDVHVVVVRQKTSRNSGYHTKKNDQVRVFETALALAGSALVGTA